MRKRRKMSRRISRSSRVPQHLTLSCLLPASASAPPPCSAAPPPSTRASPASSLEPRLAPPCLYSLSCLLPASGFSMLPASVCACAFRMKARYSECRCDMRVDVTRVREWHLASSSHMACSDARVAHAVLVDACHERCKQDKSCITSPLLYFA